MVHNNIVRDDLLHTWLSQYVRGSRGGTSELCNSIQKPKPMSTMYFTVMGIFFLSR